MSKVAVVFWSGTGNTESMAECIAEGAKAKGAAVDMMGPTDFSAAKVAEYDTFAFGCPSMGAEVLEECDYQPMWDSVMPALSGKSVLLFGSYGWGDGEWMRNWESQCQDNGITVIQALILNETPDEDGKAECKEAGEKLA